MNIEEERKAFIEACKNQFGNAYYPMNDDWSEGEFCDPVVQRHFVTWLAAKTEANKDIQMLLKICARRAPGRYAAGNDLGEVKATVAQQFYDEGFEAGIKHATEMQKSAVTINETIGGNFGVCDLGSTRPFKSFATAEQARVWATSNGYRVVEE